MKAAGMKKIPKPLLVKGIVVVFILLGLSSLLYFMNSGTLDDQIKREEQVNKKLKERTLLGRIWKDTFLVVQDMDRQRYPVETDRLGDEFLRLHKEKNLSNDALKKYWKKIKSKYYFDKYGSIHKITATDKPEPVKPAPEKKLKPADRELMERIRSYYEVKSAYQGIDRYSYIAVTEMIKGKEVKIHLLFRKKLVDDSPENFEKVKVKYLKDLKEENRMLAAEILKETLSVDVKNKRLDELDKLKADIDRIRNTIREPPRYDNPTEVVIELRKGLELLRMIPPVKKTDKGLSKSSVKEETK